VSVLRPRNLLIFGSVERSIDEAIRSDTHTAAWQDYAEYYNGTKVSMTLVGGPAVHNTLKA